MSFREGVVGSQTPSQPKGVLLSHSDHFFSKKKSPLSEGFHGPPKRVVAPVNWIRTNPMQRSNLHSKSECLHFFLHFLHSDWCYPLRVGSVFKLLRLANILPSGVANVSAIFLTHPNEANRIRAVLYEAKALLMFIEIWQIPIKLSFDSQFAKAFIIYDNN